MLLPRKMKTPAPTTGSRGSPRHGRTPGHRCLLPVGVGSGCAQRRGGRGVWAARYRGPFLVHDQCT